MSDFLGILKPSGGPVKRAQKRREISFFCFLIFIIKDHMKNILISEKQLADLVGKVKNNVSESNEPGSYMAKQQLFMLATMAYTMWEKMEDGEQLERRREFRYG